MTTLLFVDETHDSDGLAHGLERLGVRFITASSTKEALRILKARAGTIDAIAAPAESRGPNDGIWLLDQVRQLHPAVRRLLVTGTRTPALEVLVVKGEIHKLLVEPLMAPNVRDALEA